MIILSIETSCDETAVSIIEAKGNSQNPTFRILGNALYSQAKLHEEYGGVFPNLAKREHSKNLVPLFKKALSESKFLKFKRVDNKIKQNKKIDKILEREPELLKNFLELVPQIEKPSIDLIAVTYGPGLEPALWVGINFAKALAEFWNLPIVPVNHMEGHIVSVLTGKNIGSRKINFPALALLISGGHTQLVYAKKPMEYKIVGDTKDDAVGEAYDKVARMLELPYPGGPWVAKLAKESRTKKEKTKFKLPRPMIHSDDLNFSFSGLKTAVLYSLQKEKTTSTTKRQMARAFEDAVLDVLSFKTRKAIEMFRPKTLVVAGGVVANEEIRKTIKKFSKEKKGLEVLFPEKDLSTDNSVMIGIAGYLHRKKALTGLSAQKIKAEGNARV